MSIVRAQRRRIDAQALLDVPHAPVHDRAMRTLQSGIFALGTRGVRKSIGV
jgi:hypothetical protein